MKRSSSRGAEGSVNFELPVSLHVSKSFPFLKEGGNEGRQALQSARTSPTLGTHNLAATRQGGREAGGRGEQIFTFPIRNFDLISVFANKAARVEPAKQNR